MDISPLPNRSVLSPIFWPISSNQGWQKAPICDSRRLPPNIKYENLNLKDDLPFEPRSFDVVHIRFVLIHVSRTPFQPLPRSIFHTCSNMSFSFQMPDFTDIMHRVIDLVKPGGWFLLEDCDHMLYESTEIGEGTRTLFNVLNNDHFKANGCDPYLGPTFERRLKETNLFSKVNAVEINCPVSPGPISGEFAIYCPPLAYRFFFFFSLLSSLGFCCCCGQ